MKSISEERDEITREYIKKLRDLEKRVAQPVDPAVLAAWKARRRRKLIVLWVAYAALIIGIIKFSLWLVEGYDTTARIAALGFFGIPLSLATIVFPIQLTKSILKGNALWRNILKEGLPIGEIDIRNGSDDTNLVTDPENSWYSGNIYNRENDRS